MNILLQFGIIPAELEQYVIINTKQTVEFAANKYQSLLLRGLRESGNVIAVANSMYVNSFPKGFKKIRVPDFSNDVNLKTPNYSFVNTGFLNLFGIRHFSKIHNIKNNAIKILDEWQNSDKTAFVGYSVFGEALSLFPYIKKYYPHTKTCLIIPDLPNHCMGSNKIYNRYLAHVYHLLEKNKPYIDKYVLFSKYMADELNILKDNYIVIEGICDDIGIAQPRPFSDDGKKRILYSGALEERYGIHNLIDAFNLLNDKPYELHFCGAGGAEQFILNSAEKNHNIIFHGKIKNSQVIELQMNADVLINPRQNNSAYTKYSFPSKTMEYLASGTPMIGYKLDGIPDEYDPFIYYIDYNGIDEMAKRIDYVLSLPVNLRRKKGQESRDFISEHKNYHRQAKALVDFLEEDC